MRVGRQTYGRPNFVQVSNTTGTNDGVQCSGGRAGFPGGRAGFPGGRAAFPGFPGNPRFPGNPTYFFPGLSSGKSENPSPKTQIWPQLASVTTGEDHILGKRNATSRRRACLPRGTRQIATFRDFFKIQGREPHDFFRTCILENLKLLAPKYKFCHSSLRLPPGRTIFRENAMQH